MNSPDEHTDFAIVESNSRRLSWRHLPLDSILLVAVLGAANWFWARDDPGWLKWNPSPWLVLPFFLGGRYGVVPGLLGALLAGLSLLGLEWIGDQARPADLLPAGPYFLLGLLLAGAVGGLVYQMIVGPVKRLQRGSLEVAGRNRRLEEDLALYRENESILQEALLLHGAEFTSLTEELKHLFVGGGGRLEEGILEILYRCFGVTEAAVYRSSKPGSRLNRVASSGEPGRTPLALPDESAGAASEALRTCRMVTCRSMWGTAEVSAGMKETADPCLAAIPWQEAPGQAVRAMLVITRIPFEQISWSNLARIEALFAWIMANAKPAALESAGGSIKAGQVLSSDAFERRVELAARLGKELRIPSKLITFTAAAGAAPTLIPEFLEKLRLLVRPVDCIGAIGDLSESELGISAGVLTPLASVEAAETYARRLLKNAGAGEGEITVRVIPVDDRFLKQAAEAKEETTPDEIAPAEKDEDPRLTGVAQ